MTSLTYRTKHGLTQAELGKRLKVHERTVARWEQSGRYPRWLAASLAALKQPRVGRDGRR